MSKQFYQEDRPLTLDDIIGQDKTTLGLKKRFKERNFPQSFVLIGDSGLGKSSLARIIAMAIVCQHPNKDTGYPCLTCSNCKDVIDENFIMSVHEENCSNLGIDRVRELTDKANEQDFFGAPQVFILNEYQEMEAKAQKNLLPTLENYNPNSVFIVTTMDKNKIPTATKGRSQSFYLKPVDPNVLAEWMVSTLDKRGIKYPTSFLDPETGGLFTIADCCGGSPRTALSMLEQAVYSELWTKKEVSEEMDIVSSEELNQICAGILQNKTDTVFSTKWTNELLYEVRSRFVDVFKYLNGVPPKSEYFKKQVTDLASISTKEKLETILSVFFDMSKVYMNFWNTNFIEFSILRAMFLISQLDKISTVSTNAQEGARKRIPLKS